MPPALPPVAVVAHGLDHLLKSRNVAARHQGWENALGRGNILLGSFESMLETRLHDALEAGVDLAAAPGDAGRVLRHLEARDSDTTGVGGLAGGVPAGSTALIGLAVSLEHINGGLGAAHVGTLGNELASGSNQTLGFLAGDLVLSGRRQSGVDVADVQPWPGTLDVCELLAEILGVDDGRQLLALGLELGDDVDLLRSEAVLAVDNEGALAVGQGDNRASEFDDLKSFVLRDVAGAGDGDALAGEGFLTAANMFDHMVNVLLGLADDGKLGNRCAVLT